MKTILTRLFGLAAITTTLCLAALPAAAAPQASSLNIIPTITNISLLNGQLVASGIATATIHGRNFTSSFSNVPVNISLAQNQSNAVTGCPVLDLALGPINLDLLGLIVQTSPICLDISGTPNSGVLGDLLCSVSTLLNQGLPLGQILSGLNAGELSTLLTSITGILNTALGQLSNAVLTSITDGTAPGECSVLNLTLGPVNLNVLGLVVFLHNCSSDAVTVSITAQHGALLGNLLCGLTNHGLNVGTLLGDIVTGLLNSGPL